MERKSTIFRLYLTSLKTPKSCPTIGEPHILSQLKESAKLQEVGKVLAGSIGVVLLPVGGELASTFFLGFIVKSLLSILEERLLKPKELKPYKEDYANFLKELNDRIAAARYEGNMDPVVEKILSLK